MSFIKRFIKSFRKFFQYPKKKVKTKSRIRRKQPFYSKKKSVLKKESVSSVKVRKSSLKPSFQKSKNIKFSKHKTALKEGAVSGPFIGNITHFFTV